jgi:hypothetical protein
MLKVHHASVVTILANSQHHGWLDFAWLVSWSTTMHDLGECITLDQNSTLTAPSTVPALQYLLLTHRLNHGFTPGSRLAYHSSINHLCLPFLLMHGIEVVPICQGK